MTEKIIIKGAREHNLKGCIVYLFGDIFIEKN